MPILRYFLAFFSQLQAFIQVLGIPGDCNFGSKLNSQIKEGLRCFGPYHLFLWGPMGNFKVFFQTFFQLKAFRAVLLNCEWQWPHLTVNHGNLIDSSASNSQPWNFDWQWRHLPVKYWTMSDSGALVDGWWIRENFVGKLILRLDFSLAWWRC